jgi:ribose transport system substrate-binding protein
MIKKINMRTVIVFLTAVSLVAGSAIMGSTANAAGTAKGKKVQYIAFGLQYDYQVALVGAVQAAATKAGIELTVLDGKGDPNLQVTQAADTLAKKPDALLYNPIDGSLFTNPVKEANTLGIPVFIEENSPPEGKVESMVDFDNVAGGAMAADIMAKAVGGKGTVLETRGSVASAQAQDRHKGFITQMKKYPGIKIKSLNTEWTADNANKMVLDALTRDPKIVGVWSHNDEMVRGVISALKQAGKTAKAGKKGHIVVGGLDGTALALDRIRGGSQDFTVEQSPYAMGEGILNQIVAYFEGKPVQKHLQTKPNAITKANVDSPKNWGNAKK